MKKIVLSALLMLAVCGSAFAHEMELNDYKVFGKLNNETTLRSLVRYLNADEEQHGQLKYIFQLTERKVNLQLKKAMKYRQKMQCSLIWVTLRAFLARNNTANIC